LAVAFASSLVLLVAIAAYGFMQSRRADQARDFATDMLALERLVLQVEAAGTRVEAHHRGFLITGDERMRRDREHAYERGTALLRTLSAQVRDPEEQVLVRRVESLLRARHDRMLATDAVIARDGPAAGRAMFRGHGVGSVDPVLRALEELQREHARLLDDNTRQALARTREFGQVLVYGTAFALMLLMAAVLALLKQARRNERLGAELLQLSRAQEAKAAELERSNRELEAFSYSISHDLRAPLRHIDGYARMLQEDAAEQLDAEARRYLDAIGDSSRRMGALIDDLLAFARLGRRPVERVPVDMDELVRHALDEAGGGTSAALVDVAPLPAVQADPVLMRQAWVNLLSNALKYSAPKGADARIDVSGERDAGCVRYRIRDNGVGFDMRYADKLFGVFQRLHAQEEFEGTGVGLAIVQQIVERHGGRITAEARPGAGACFTIELPSGGTA